MELLRILESILFTANKPLDLETLKTLVNRGAEAQGGLPELATLGAEEVAAGLEQLRTELESSSIMLTEVAGGYRLATRDPYFPWVRAMFDEARPPKLSQPALETLAVIAYRQPISRAEIEAVRGVAVGGVLETLVDRAVVRVAGRADVPGRPLLYETTPYFLEHFGLRDLNDLPNVEELKRVKLPDPKPEADPNQQPELIHESAGNQTEN